MTTSARLFAMGIGIALLGAAPPAGPKPEPRPIPGLTAPDRFPDGCVDCHTVLPGPPGDMRISTLMKGWTAGVSPTLLEKARAAAPKGMELKGRHPAVPASNASIPKSCLACHGRESKTAPPFASLLHAVHLQGGERSAFLTEFGGECTHCHKLDPATGRASVASAPEK